MSSKVSYMPIVDMPKNQLLETIRGQVSQLGTDRRFNQQAATDERRFQLRMARQDRQDSLQAARNSLADRRYEDRISHRDKLEAEAKQNESDALQGMLDASTSGFDVGTTEMIDVEDHSKTVEQYDTENVNKTLAAKNLQYGEVKEVLTQPEIEKLKAYDELANITDPIEKRKAELALATAGLTKEQLGGDSLGTKLMKKADGAVAFVNDGIENYVLDPVANMFSANEGESILRDENTIISQKKNADSRKINDPLLNYRDKIKALQKRQTSNNAIRKKNKENNALVEEILGKNKSDVYDGVSKKQEKVLMNRSDYSNATRKQMATQIKQIMAKKTSTAYKKAALAKILGTKKEADAIYKADRKEQITTLQAKMKRAQDLGDKKAAARYKSRLSYQLKKRLQEDKEGSPQYIANLKKTNKQTKRIENQIKNNK